MASQRSLRDGLNALKYRFVTVARKLPSLCHLASGVDLAYGIDDIRVSPAAADIARHPFTYLFIGKLDVATRCGHAGRNIAGLAVLCLLQQSDSRTDLPGCAVPALKSIMLNKRRL